MANKASKIKEALGKLNAGNDNHWTTEGAPRLETLRMMAGDPTISREDVNGVDQGFTRQTLSAKSAEPVDPVDPATSSNPSNPTGPMRSTDPVKPNPPIRNEGATENDPGNMVDPTSSRQNNDGRILGETAATPPVDAEGNLASNRVADIQSIVPQYNALGQITNDLGQTTTRRLEELGTEENLDKQIELGEKTIADMDANLANLTKKRNEFQRMLDILNSRKVADQLPEHLHNQKEIAAYLEKQQQQRAQLAGQMGEFGLRSLPSNLRAPLDQSLSQKGRTSVPRK